MKRLQTLLKEVGLESERVHMFNLSAAMAGQFVDATKEMTEQVRALGSSPLKKHQDEG